MTKRFPGDVTVFRGPNGVFAVTQSDSNTWHIEKAPENLEDMYSWGETIVETLWAKTGNSGGYFEGPIGRDGALRAAREKAGVDILPTHPLPDRRGLVTHTRAMS